MFILKTQVQTFFLIRLFLFCTHRTNPSLRRQPYCDCKLPSISFSALFVRERISTEITHHDKRGRPVAQIGSWWCNWMQKLFAPPTQQNLIFPLTTTTTTSQGRRKRAKSEQPTAPLQGGLLENLPTIQRRVFATALRGKSGQKRQKQPQQSRKQPQGRLAPRPQWRLITLEPLRDQISQRENGLSHLMRAGRERKKEKEVSERNVQGHCTAKAARREN